MWTAERMWQSRFEAADESSHSLPSMDLEFVQRNLTWL
jgi:hypothetical protein